MLVLLRLNALKDSTIADMFRRSLYVMFDTTRLILTLSRSSCNFTAKFYFDIITPSICGGIIDQVVICLY